MTETLDLATWPGADQFRFFRTYPRPHYALTARVDVTALVASRARCGLSPFRTCLWAIGAGLHAVPALRTRFRETTVTRYGTLDLSPAIAVEGGDFRYTYIRWQPDRSAFDADAAEKIAAVRAGAPLNANTSGGRQDVAYLSCLPWLDYTSLDNALPGPDDCIPRVGWGKIVPGGKGHDMAVTLQVHHALVHGRDAGRFFEALGDALAGL